MNRRLLGFIATALLLAGTTAFAQPPGGGNPGRDVEVVPKVGPEEVRRVGDWLRKMQAPQGMTPQVLDELKKLRQQNPYATDEQIARQFADKYPQLKDPEVLAKWKDYFDKLGQTPNDPQQGKGVELPKVNNPFSGERPRPGDVPPVIPNFPKFDPGKFDPRRPKGPDRFPPNGGPLPHGGRDRPPFGEPPQFPAPRPGRTPEFDPDHANRRNRQFQAAAGSWEKNFGPLDDSPAVKQLLFEVITGQDGTGQNQGGLGDLFDGTAPDGKSLGNMLDGNVDSSGFKMPEFGFGKLDFGGPPDASPSAPRPPSGGSSMSGFGSPGEGSWLPVILFVGVLGGALLLWWLWPKLTGESTRPRPVAGLGPWPVDPRKIHDRASLVKAFEYLSVLLHGGDARTWNHLEIAAAFREKMPEAEAIAEPLAWLYAVARYTPADEPLPPNAIEKAREYLCDLAGVSPA